MSPFRIYYLVIPIIADSQPNLQFGTGTSGKNFKRAVDRNRIKRLTREAYRLQKKPLQEALKQKGLGLNVFFIYTSKELPGYNIVKEKVNVILSKLIQIINESNSPST